MIAPAKVALPLVSPTVSVFALRLTAELAAPVRDRIAWSVPSASVELPVPLWSMMMAEREGEVGSALAALALSVAPSMM